MADKSRNQSNSRVVRVRPNDALAEKDDTLYRRDVTGGDVTGGDIAGRDVIERDVIGRDVTGSNETGRDVIGRDVTGRDNGKENDEIVISDLSSLNKDRNSSSNPSHLPSCSSNCCRKTSSRSPLISRRALETSGSTTAINNFLHTARFRWSKNAFDDIQNPGGITNVGTAENKVGAQQLKSKIAEITKKMGESNGNGGVEHLNYFEFRGIRSVREKVAKFLDNYFVSTHTHCANSKFRVDPDRLIITNGCGSAQDLLAHVIADEGDVILSPTPHYKRIENNFQERALVKTIYLPLSSEDGWTLTIDHIKNGYEKATAEGKNVRALVLVNPHNPLGTILDRATLWTILQFCRDKKIHVVFDEIYRLCLLKGCLREFASILQFGENIPDPDRTHFVWSMSKDFGMSGFRFGVLYTHSKSIAKALTCFSYFSAVPSIIQEIVGEMLSDYDWIDRVYLPVCRAGMKERLEMATTALESVGVYVYPGTKAGLYLWVYIGDFLGEKTFTAEKDFCQHLFQECGCYVIPGCELDCPEPGWVRIVFTISTRELEVFLERFCAALKAERRQSEEEEGSGTDIEMGEEVVRKEDDETEEGDETKEGDEGEGEDERDRADERDREDETEETGLVGVEGERAEENEIAGESGKDNDAQEFDFDVGSFNWRTQEDLNGSVIRESVEEEEEEEERSKRSGNQAFHHKVHYDDSKSFYALEDESGEAAAYDKNANHDFGSDRISKPENGKEKNGVKYRNSFGKQRDGTGRRPAPLTQDLALHPGVREGRDGTTKRRVRRGLDRNTGQGRGLTSAEGGNEDREGGSEGNAKGVEGGNMENDRFKYVAKSAANLLSDSGNRQYFE